MFFYIVALQSGAKYRNAGASMGDEVYFDALARMAAGGFTIGYMLGVLRIAFLYHKRMGSGPPAPMILLTALGILTVWLFVGRYINMAGAICVVSIIVGWFWKVLFFPKDRKLDWLCGRILELQREQVKTDNWSDSQRREAVQGLSREDIAEDDILAEWQLCNKRSFLWDTIWAQLYLGIPAWQAYTMMKRDNEERIKRWSLITGKAIPWR